jgi:peptide/nickel transport system permease protein
MGTRPSVLASLVLVAIIAATGTTIGIVAAWRGGRLDAVLMRVADVFLAFPSLVFALAVAGVLGGGVVNAVIALAVVSWPKYARLARGLVLSLRQEPYLKASRLAGCGTLRLVVRHVLPNIAGTLLVTAMMDVGTMMMELAALSFLGLGAQPPMAEWGSMMSESRSLLQTAPWLTFAPGLAIFVSVMIFNLLGDTVRDYLDPKMRGGQRA